MIHRVYSKRQKKHVWAYDLRVNGRRVRDSGFATKEEATNAVATLRLEMRARRYGFGADRSRVTLDKLIEARTRDLTPDWAAATRTRRRSVRILHRFAARLPSRCRVDQITHADLVGYVQERAVLIKPQTILRELADICSMLGVAWTYFPELQGWQPPERPEIKVPKHGRERVWTEDEVRRVLAVLLAPRRMKANLIFEVKPDGSTRAFDCGSNLSAVFNPNGTHRSGELYALGTLAELKAQFRCNERAFNVLQRHTVADVLQIALMSGMRKSEILSLRWDDINFAWRTVRVHATKTDTVRVVPMTETVFAVLQRRGREREDTSNPFVFPDRYGRSSQKRFDGTLHRTARIAGVVYGSQRTGGAVFHDCRHTATTAMLHDNHDIATIQSITGHSTQAMLLHYGHASARSRQTAIDSLERFAPAENESVRLASAVESVGSVESVQSEAQPQVKSTA